MNRFIGLLLFPGFLIAWPSDWKIIETKTFKKNENLVTKEVIQHPKNFLIHLTAEAKYTKDQIILGINNVLAWKSWDIQSVYISAGIGEIRYLVQLSRYQIGGTDVLNKIPSGIMFIQDKVFSYTYRIQVDKFFVKIKGYYQTEADFNKKLMGAIEDPTGYIRSRDPQFILDRLEVLQDKVDRMEIFQNRLRYAVITLENQGFFSKPKEIRQSKIDKIIELKAINPKWKAKKFVEEMEKIGIEIDTDEVEIIIAVYFNEFEK